MAASDEQIRNTIEQYVSRVATGTADQIMELYAEGATVEDPVGSDVLTTRDTIREFYASLEPLEQEATVLDARICAGQAAFRFEIRTKADGATYLMSPIDVMTFDDDARITSMRAFWSPSDMTVA